MRGRTVASAALSTRATAALCGRFALSRTNDGDMTKVTRCGPTNFATPHRRTYPMTERRSSPPFLFFR